MRKELSAVYLAGLLQGVVLVAFPAASSLLTSSTAFALSSWQYGALFIPQSILSIAASAFSAKISCKLSAKTTYLVGLFANCVAMSLFCLSAFIVKEAHFVYSLLLFATTFVGIGFGLTVPTINTMAASLRPKQVDTVILILNALLGVGTVLAPVLISFFIGLGIWWGFPLVLVATLSLLIIFSLPLPLPGKKTDTATSLSPLPKRAFLFMAFALFYGMVETLNGNWAAIYMREVQKASVHMQSMALTIFWAWVTSGRIFFACIERYLPGRLIYQGLPIVIAAAFLSIGLLPPMNPYITLCFIGLAGLGCSALLPLTISIGSTQLPAISRSISGIVIAFYLSGYGIAAFLPGVILDLSSYTLSNVYAGSAVAAILLALLAYFINRKNS